MKRLPILLSLAAAAGLSLMPAAVLQAKPGDRSERYSRAERAAESAVPASTNPANADAPRPGKPLPADYDILAKRSIFEKDRRPYRAPSRSWESRGSSATTAATARPPAIPILIGVILGDDGYIAYIEDPDSGKLWPLAPGDPLPSPYGNVEAVTLDDMQIAPETGASRHILIGQNLAGETPPSAETAPLTPAAATTTVATSQPGNTSATAAPPAASTLPDGSGGLTIEQRMKLKRQQQLGQ